MDAILTPPPAIREETPDEFGSRWRPFCLSLPDNSAFSDDIYKTPCGNVSQYDETFIPSDLLPFKSYPPELVSPSCSLYSSGVSTPNSAPFSPMYGTGSVQTTSSFMYGNHLDKSDYFSDPLLEDKYLDHSSLKFGDDCDFTSHQLDFSSLAPPPPSSAPQVRTPMRTGTNPYYTPTFAPRRSASSISNSSRCSSSSNTCCTLDNSRTSSPSLNLDNQAPLAHSRSRSEAFLLSRSCSPCSVPDEFNSISGTNLHRRMMSMPSVNEADLNPDSYFNFSQSEETPYTTLHGGLALLESTTTSSSASCSTTDYSSNDESLHVTQEYSKKAPPAMRPLTGDDPPVDSSKPHCCKLCDRSFKRQEHLRRHLRTHTNERPYACSAPGCKRKFSRRDNLRAHIKTHTRRGGRNGYVEGLDPSTLSKD